MKALLPHEKEHYDRLHNKAFADKLQKQKEVKHMGTIKEEAEAYESKKTKNIADLPEISAQLNLEDDEFEFEKDGKTKIIKQKVAIVNGEKYRVPNSVLEQLKVQLKHKPDLDKFKVDKEGTGLDTKYTVIPL